MMLGVLSTIVAGTVCAGLLAWLLRRSSRLPLDHPNERSLHDQPTPRIGGLGLIPGVLASWLCAAIFDPILVLVAVLTSALFLMSIADDARGLPIGIRFGGHLTAGLAVAVTLAGELEWPAVLVAGLAITWMTNLYNFMDGANGLAGGMTALGFATYGVAAAIVGEDSIAAFSLAATGAALGFLPFNFPRARLFLGDAGSIPLGFLAGALGLVGVTRDIWPIWFPLLVFSPFILDASITLARRALRGAQVWHAHRDHYYQRLIRLGWSHRRMAIVEYGLMTTTGLSALWLRESDSGVQLAGLASWLAVYVALMVAIDRRWARHAKGAA